MRFLVLICLLSSLIGPSRSDWANSCHHCECKWMGGKKVANCSSAGLTQVPTNLNKEIQVLILDNNTITRLGENVFQDSLPNLQKIFIRHAGLRTIHPTAFYNLKILIEVDLSYNSITKLDKKTFDGNGRLKMVSFANNPIQVLESFQFPVLPHLKTIDFSFCQIDAIQTSAFGNLGNSIEAIKLQGNKLKGLQEEVFLSLTNLKSLELHRNPWRCDCNLKSFREWIVARGLYNYPTTCKEPERLAEKLWDNIPSTEFACKPKIQVSQGRVYSQPGTNVTLGCLIKGNPIPEAKWVLRGRIVNNNTSPSGSNTQIYLIHELGGLERWFNLTVVNLQEEDADDYTCVAVNAGGVSEQNVSLTFDTPVILGDSQEPREKKEDEMRTVLAVAGGCMLTLLSVSLVSYICCSTRRRRGQAQNDSQNIMEPGFSDSHRLLEPRGILKNRGNPGDEKDRNIDFESYPDLLNTTDKSDRLTLGNTSGHMQTPLDANQAPDQPLDPNHLPCCTCYTAPQAAVMEINCTCPTSVPSNFTIPTAAILPPPPSFLAPYTSPVQTVPLQTGGKEGNRFITLPRHTRQKGEICREEGNSKNINRQNLTDLKSKVMVDIPPVPPPVQFTTCCTNPLCDQIYKQNIWVKTQNSCQTLPNPKNRNMASIKTNTREF